MCMPLKRFPRDVIEKYILEAISVDGWVYIEIGEEIYGLKQAGLLANPAPKMFGTA
jgi:hypothetical protein